MQLSRGLSDGASATEDAVSKVNWGISSQMASGERAKMYVTAEGLMSNLLIAIAYIPFGRAVAQST